MESADTARYLSSLSGLAGRSFGSTEEMTGAVLRLVAEELGMRSSLLSRIDRSRNELEVLASHNAPGGCDIRSGDSFELRQTF